MKFNEDEDGNFKRKTMISREISPLDCNFKQIGNQNLFLHWGIFAESFPEEILENLHRECLSRGTADSEVCHDSKVDIPRSYLYREQTSFYYDEARMGLGYMPIHLVDFHDVPNSMWQKIFLFSVSKKILRSFIWVRFKLSTYWFRYFDNRKKWSESKMVSNEIFKFSF